MSTPVSKIVESLIMDNFVVVFSKSYCPFCVKAKNLLSSLSIGFKALELDQIDNGDTIQSYLYQKTGQRTVPSVFIGKEHIGGCDDLHALHRQGELIKLINKK